MQPHKWISIVPMPARPVVPVHNHDAGTGFVKQRIGKCHADGAAADD